jgi:hypothetical protein
MYAYRRLRVVRQPEKAGSDFFHIRLAPTSPKTQVRFPNQQLQTKLRMSPVQNSVPVQKSCRWEASFDMRTVPAGDLVDLIYECHSPGDFLQRGEYSTVITFEVQVETAELTRWILLPEGKEYRNFRLTRYEKGKPDKVEAVKMVTEYLADDYTILAYKLLALKPGYIYSVQWYYK